MDPFRIICPACSTKLVVRQPELVGRTVPCPKCKNAIHVVRPGQVAWNPGSVNTNEPIKPSGAAKTPTAQSPPKRPVSSVNSEAITKADPGDWDIDALESALSQQNSSVSAEETVGFFRDPTGDPPTRKRESQPLEIQPLEPNDTTPNPPVTPPSAWQSPQAKARRQLLTVLIVGIAGCVLASLAFLAFLNTFGKRNRDKAPVEDNPAVVAKADQAVNPAEKPELMADAAPKIDAIEPVDAQDPTQPIAQEAPGLKVNPLGLPPENIQAENQPNLPAPDPGTPPMIEQSNPSNLQENSLKPNNLDKQPQEAQAAVSQPADDNLPSIFKDFLPVFDRSSQPGWSDLGKVGEKTIDQELALENADVVFAPEYYPQPIPLPNWTERAERKVGRVRIPPMSVPRFVHWLNRLSGHAISIDWFLFNLSDIPLDQNVEFQSDGTTIAGILDELKTKIGADLDTDAKGFVYLRPRADKLSTKLKPDGTTQRGALAQGLPDGQDQAILKLVLDLLQIDGCEYRDGKLNWGANSNAYQQAQVLAALASIREAISGENAQKEAANDPSVFDFNRPEAWVKLFRQSQTKLAPDEILYEERPIVDIMAKAAQASRTELLFDWPAVWSHGLHPNRLALSLLRGRSFLEISNRFLEDHSLELVPMDSKTWMLTTEDRRRAMFRLVAVRTDRGVSLEDMRVSIRGIVPRGMDGKSMFSASPIPGADGIVLLRICPPSSNQLADEELLKALGQIR